MRGGWHHEGWHDCKGGRKLEQQPRQESNRSSQDKSSGGSGKGSIGDGSLPMPTAGGREKARPTLGENGAPGWEKERGGKGEEVPLKA